MQRMNFFFHTFKVGISVAIAAAIALGSLGPAAATVKEKKMAKPKSLYQRLGGKKAIKAVVDDFVNNVVGDSRINKFLADTAKDPKRLAAFKSNLVDQICQASGGPCKYTGKDMKTAMGISEADFNALVEDLAKALDKLPLGTTEENEQIARVLVSTSCQPEVCPIHGTCKNKCKKYPCICPKN